MSSGIKPHPTRERILEAAAEAISAKSYSACGISEIVKAAGVPKGSFYHFFESKENLGVEVIRREVESISEVLGRRFRADFGGPADRIKAYYRLIREECLSTGLICKCPVAKLALEVAHLSEPMRVAINEGYERWAELHQELIQTAQEEGVVSGDLDASLVAEAIISGFEGAALRMQTSRSIEPIDTFIEFAIDRLLGLVDE